MVINKATKEPVACHIKRFTQGGYFMGCYELFADGKSAPIGDVMVSLESLDEQSKAVYIESIRNLTITDEKGNDKQLSHVGIALLAHVCTIAADAKKDTLAIIPTGHSDHFWKACGFVKESPDPRNKIYTANCQHVIEHIKRLSNPSPPQDPEHSSPRM